MKIIQGLKKLLILFVVSAILFINVIPSFAADGNLTYTYDDLNRLRFIEDTTGKIVEYQYDEVGNRTHKIVSYSYTVTFDSQGAEVAANPTSKTVVSPATTIDALPTPPTKAGSTFVGWFTVESGGGTQFIATTAVTGNITVYAYWIANPVYTVTYNSEGGTAVDAQHVTAPATTVGTLPANPTKTGYTFGGWYTAPDGGGTQFTASTTVAADITVYAKWNSSSPVSIGSTSYATLQAAYDVAGTGVTIKVKAINITENLNVNRDISVNLEGGYNDDYSSITGNTTLTGKIQTYPAGGTLTIKNFILQN